MKKKSMLMCLALVMSLAMAISGTLAYLTDTETTTNVMTVGNVDIELIELQRKIVDGEYVPDGNGEFVLEPFEDGKPLYPVVIDEEGSIENPETSIVEKEVRVENTGSSDAFVRVIVAFPELNGKAINDAENSPIVVQYNEGAFGGTDAPNAKPEIVENVDIMGKKHTLWVFTYSNALAAKATSESSLYNFYMSPDVTNADLAGFDGEYRVLVAAQAMQTVNMGGRTAEQALDLGFDDITTTSHPWSGMTTPVDLTDKTEGQSFIGDGTTVIENTYQIFSNKVSDFTIKNGTPSQVKGDSVFNNCEFIAGENGKAFWADHVLEDGATITFNNCTFDGILKLGGNETNKYVFNNCSFSADTTDSLHSLITIYGQMELNNCTFDRGEGVSYDVYKSIDLSSDLITVTGNSAIVAGKKSLGNGTYSNIIVEVLPKEATDKVVVNVGADATAEEKTAAIQDAIKNGAEEVYLPTGEYKLPSLSGETLTITGGADTVIDTTAGFNSTSGADLTFDGVTVKFANENYKGFTHAKKVVYKNCTLIGQMTMYADTEFINCTFETDGDIYSVWTYGKNATFTNCTFNTDGKAVLVYNEGVHNSTIKLTGCTFNDSTNGTVGKGAVETGVNGANVPTINIEIEDCEVNGFAVNTTGISTGTKLVGNKNAMDPDHLNVIIDGKDVY